MKLAGIVAAAVTCCYAQERPDVSEVLGHVGDTYAHLTYYHFKIYNWPWRSYERSFVNEFAGEIPGKFAVIESWGTGCVTDGHNTWRYSRSDTNYFEAMARPYDPTAPDPDTPPATPIARAADQCERQFVRARDFFVDRWTKAPQWSLHASVAGEGSLRVNGSKRRCWIVKIDPLKGVHSELWIDQATFLVLREKYKNREDKEHMNYQWTLAEITKPSDRKAFQFRPPRRGIKQSDPGETLIGESAPDFTFKNWAGVDTALSSLKGIIVLLYFWATWTPEADQRMKAADNWWRTYRQTGVTVIGISYQGKHETDKDVRKFLAKNGIDFPNYMDATGELHSAYRIDLLPTVVVIDSEGLIHQYLRQDDQLEHWETAALGIP